MFSPIGANAIFWYNYLDKTLSHICRINIQYVWLANQQKVMLPEFDKIDVIKELFNVKYDFASVPVLDLADIVYNIELLCTE